jgi:proteic killer suppression protein
VEISYKNNKIKKSLTNDKELIKTYGELAKKIKQRLKELKEADSLLAISQLPALRLHPYKGGRTGEWSIDIKENWRIIFEIAQDPIPKREDGGVNLILISAIEIVSVEDPH